MSLQNEVAVTQTHRGGSDPAIMPGQSQARVVPGWRPVPVRRKNPLPRKPSWGGDWPVTIMSVTSRIRPRCLTHPEDLQDVTRAYPGKLYRPNQNYEGYVAKSCGQRHVLTGVCKSLEHNPSGSASALEVSSGDRYTEPDTRCGNFLQLPVRIRNSRRHCDLGKVIGKGVAQERAVDRGSTQYGRPTPGIAAPSSPHHPWT